MVVVTRTGSYCILVIAKTVCVICATYIKWMHNWLAPLVHASLASVKVGTGFSATRCGNYHLPQVRRSPVCADSRFINIGIRLLDIFSHKLNTYKNTTNNKI